VHQVVHAPRRNTADPGFLDHRHQRFFGGLPGLEERREIVGPSPQLRDPRLQRAKAGIERAVAIAVPVGAGLDRAFVPPGADHTSHIGLHQQLQHGLSD
jgi:hypothetical protein